jgi:hypothetical protein
VQNEELTKELDQFVQANEAIRMRLDRKARVQEIRARKDQIMYMRKELEGARYSNSALLDNNSNL